MISITIESEREKERETRKVGGGANCPSPPRCPREMLITFLGHSPVMSISRNRDKHHASYSFLIAVSILLVGIMGPFCFLQPVEAGERPNSHAVMNVRYSPTRYNPVPQWKEGVIELELYEKRAPLTTANFIKLSEDGFYNGLLFHRVIDDFVIQGGDPNTRDNNNQLDWWNDGEGGSNETIDLEIHPELTHVDGAIGMARELGNPDSASSQFYICDGPQHRLDDNEENNANRTFRAIDENGYAVFGVTVEGIEVVRDIAMVWTTTDLEVNTVDPIPTAQAHLHDHPIYDVLLSNVTIIHYKAPSDDSGLTAQQAAGIGVGIFIAIGVVVIILLRKGKLPELEKRIPEHYRKL